MSFSRRSTFSIALLFWAFFFTLAPGSAYAESAPQPCLFKKSLQSLATLKEQKTGDYLVDVRSEAQLRRSLLRQSFLCSQREARELRENLAGVDLTDEALIEAKMRSIAILDEVLRFHDARLRQLNEAGIRASQTAARDLLDIRRTQYAPAARTAVNLIMWQRNVDLLTTARSRMSQIESTVERLSPENSAELSASIEDAREAFEQAKKTSDEAREVLVSAPASESSLTPIKESLEQLASTYRAFFELSSLVKQILPH